MTDTSTETSTTDQAKQAAQDTAGTAAEQGRQVAQTAAEQGREVASTATSEAAEVAATAADQAKQVVGAAQEQISTVGGQAVEQARNVMGSATTEVRDQLEQRLRDLAGTARSTATELQALCEGRPEEAGRTKDLAEQAGQRLSSMADRAEELGVQGVVEEVSDFARRRPLVFLAGAVTAGVLVGRLAKAGREAQASSSSDGGQPSGAVGPTATPGWGEVPAAAAPVPAGASTITPGAAPVLDAPITEPVPAPPPAPLPPPAAPGTDPGGTASGWVGGR